MKQENQLLSRILRAVTGVKPETEAVAPVEAPVEAVVAQEVDVVTQAVEAAQALAANEQAVETLSIQIDSAVIADFQSQLDAVKAEFGVQLEAATSALADMAQKYEGAQAALLALATEKEAMLAAQAVAKLTARRTRVEAAIGTDKAAGLMAATEGLEDAQFDLVIAALAGSVDAESQSTLFQEVGVTAEADATQIVTESAEMRILKQKYGAK